MLGVGQLETWHVVQYAYVQTTPDVFFNRLVAVRKQTPVFAVPNVTHLDALDGSAMLSTTALTLDHGNLLYSEMLGL